MSTQVRKRLLSSVTGEQQDCCGSSHTVIPINILAASAMHLGKYLKAILLLPPHIYHQLSHAFLSLYQQKANSKQMSNSILNLFHGNFFLTCFFCVICFLCCSILNFQMQPPQQEGRLVDRQHTNSLL